MPTFRETTIRLPGHDEFTVRTEQGRLTVAKLEREHTKAVKEAVTAARLSAIDEWERTELAASSTAYAERVMKCAEEKRKRAVPKAYARKDAQKLRKPHGPVRYTYPELPDTVKAAISAGQIEVDA